MTQQKNLPDLFKLNCGILYLDGKSCGNVDNFYINLLLDLYKDITSDNIQIYIDLEEICANTYHYIREMLFMLNDINITPTVIWSHDDNKPHIKEIGIQLERESGSLFFYKEMKHSVLLEYKTQTI